MQQRTSIPFLGAAWLLITAAHGFAGAPEKPQDKQILIGHPVSLAVSPDSIRLSGPRGMRQVLVTGRYADGSVRDLTSACSYQIVNPEVANLSGRGFLQARKSGETKLKLQAGALSTTIPVLVSDFQNGPPVSFRQDFIAALNVAGCNMGACHGIPSGRGGFKLSLRGYNPDADYIELTHSAQGRRTNRFDPEQSLILKKGLALVPHQGGRRLITPNLVPLETIRGWLGEGLRQDRSDLPSLKKVEVLPGQRVQTSPARYQQLVVLGHFADGTVRDVTRLTAFSSSDESIAEVDVTGLVEMHQRGEAAILCRYLDTIECVRLTYLEPQASFVWSNPPANNAVDQHVFAKLKMLNILPSDLCLDHEFLRRASLDLCGILPNPEQTRAFLADTDPAKRDKLIDALVERPEFADFWTHKWLDVLRSNRLTIQIRGSHKYQFWLRNHIAHNTPWNEVVRELLTASGSTFLNPPANYFRGTYNFGEPAVREPNNIAESTSQIFLGIRLQCAQCHNHPFERWTQDDYLQMVAWFKRLQAKQDPLELGGPRPNYSWQLRENALVIFSKRDGEVISPQTGKVMAPKVLGMPTPTIPAGTDRRIVLAELITSPENPFFARATVNRLWFHLLGRGIVDPPDDFRDSNPSVNDPLLDELAREFVRNNFDLKYIIRMIAKSRTYQLSTQVNASNQSDEKYFSHAFVKRKRLSAEVLLDAICTVTAEPETFTDMPAGTRSTQLPDGQVIYTGGRYASWDRHPFLKAFGQPAREAPCECEREGDINLDRALELKNGDFLLGKVRAPKNRLGQLLSRKVPDSDFLNELFVVSLTRPPRSDESNTVRQHVSQAKDKRAAWEDVLWALLNSNEFLFRH